MSTTQLWATSYCTSRLYDCTIGTPMFSLIDVGPIPAPPLLSRMRVAPVAAVPVTTWSVRGVHPRIPPVAGGIMAAPVLAGTIGRSKELAGSVALMNALYGGLPPLLLASRFA